MTKQEKQLANKLHKNISSSDMEFKKNLGSANDWNSYLSPRTDGFSIVGDSPNE